MVEYIEAVQRYVAKMHIGCVHLERFITLPERFGMAELEINAEKTAVVVDVIFNIRSLLVKFQRV